MKKLKWHEEIKLKRISPTKIGIISKLAPNYKCDLCLKRRKTKSHHLIPRRMKIANKPYGRITIKVCNPCHEELHPENFKIDSIKIIRKQDKLIDRYRAIIKNQIEGKYNDILFILSRKKLRLKKECDEVVNEMPKRKIHSQHKYYEGRIKEINATSSMIKGIQSNQKKELRVLK